MKAQFWSFDIVFATVIFVLSVVILAYAWLNISGQFAIASSNSGSDMQMQLNTLSSRLTEPGAPQSWNSEVNATNTATWSNISIGLGTGAYEALSAAKIMSLAAMSNYNYQDTKEMLGVGYDYYIVIQGDNYHISMGSSPASGATSVLVSTTPVIINDRPVRMQVMLWTNTSFGVI